VFRNSATLYQTTQRYLPEDMNFCKHYCEKIKSSRVKTFQMPEGSIMCTSDLNPRGLWLWLDISYIKNKETAWAELS
jgi:hypothetical protein